MLSVNSLRLGLFHINLYNPFNLHLLSGGYPFREQLFLTRQLLTLGGELMLSQISRTSALGPLLQDGHLAFHLHAHQTKPASCWGGGRGTEFFTGGSFCCCSRFCKDSNSALWLFHWFPHNDCSAASYPNAAFRSG